jgi:cell division septal protein FtsQ
MNKYKAISAFVFVIGIIAAAIIFSGLWKDKSTVKKVELYGNTTLSKEEIFDFAKLSDSTISANSLTLDMIESRIAKHPNIKKVNVTRESGTIKIEISEKNPFAIVTNSKEMFLVDDQLTMYPFKKEQKDIDLPVVSGLSAQMDMTNFGKNDLANLKIAQYVIASTIKLNRSLYHYISEVSFLDTNGINIITSDDAVPIYMVDYTSLHGTDGKDVSHDISNPVLKKDINRKLVYLNNFLKQVRVYKTSNSFAYIDMRYNDMIVVKNNKMPVTD